MSRFLLISSLLFLLVACSPHAATGVWKATDDNEWGISRLVSGFEGRVEFTRNKPQKSVWHCFWGISNEKELALECTSSLSPEEKKFLVLRVNDQGLAELKDETKLLATFTRSDENPSPKK